VFASPSNMTQTGRDALAADPNNQGSLGLAISEAVEEAASRSDTNYALGSVLNHVVLHQTIIGLEAKTILVNLTGHGHFDMGSYDRYFAGELEDFEYPEAAIQQSLQHLPKFD
jgi:predicted alternative tryptophan synthase beta-subunit